MYIVFRHQVVLFSLSLAVIQCKHSGESSYSGAADAGMDATSVQHHSCVVDNYDLDGETNYKSCPHGIVFRTDGFQLSSNTIAADFVCYKSAREMRHESLRLSGGNGSWKAISMSAVPGQELEFRYDSKGRIIFESLPLTMACNSYQPASRQPARSQEPDNDQTGRGELPSNSENETQVPENPPSVTEVGGQDSNSEAEAGSDTPTSEQVAQLRQCLMLELDRCDEDTLCKPDDFTRKCIHQDVEVIPLGTRCGGYRLQWGASQPRIQRTLQRTGFALNCEDPLAEFETQPEQ